MAAVRSGLRLWLFVASLVVAGVASAVWWAFRPYPTTYVSHPPGVGSLTTYRPESLTVSAGVVPFKDGVFYYEHGSSSYAGFTGVEAGIVSNAGTLRQHDVRTTNEFESVALGAGGTLWATSILGDDRWPPVWHGAIERIGPAGSRVVFRIPNHLGHAEQLLLGPDGAWWFALPEAHRIGRLSHDAHFTSVAHFGSMKPDRIAFDSTGMLYAAERSGHRVAQVLPGGKVRVFVIPSRDGELGALAAGGDRDIWFTEQTANRIGHIMKTGRVEEFTTGPGVIVLDALAVSRDSVWFAVRGGMGRLSLRTHALTVIALPDSFSWPNDVAISRTGDVWFTESIGDSRCVAPCGGIARISP